MRIALTHLRLLLQQLFVLSLAVLAGRFTWVAAAPLLSEVPAPIVAIAKTSVAPAVKVATPMAEPARPAAHDEMLSLLLLAQHTRKNSQVFVNDELIGQTNFMRNFSCRAGELLRLKIVPSKGPAIEKQMHCQGETLSISDRP